MRLSLPGIIVLLSLAGASAYVSAAIVRRRLRSAVIDDDDAAEIIVRYRPAIERALRSEPDIV